MHFAPGVSGRKPYRLILSYYKDIVKKKRIFILLKSKRKSAADFAEPALCESCLDIEGVYGIAEYCCTLAKLLFLFRCERRVDLSSYAVFAYYEGKA